MKTKYEIVTGEYYSNCMIEALKAKLHNPKIKVYFCKPRITENGHFQMFHFMWSDGNADYDFSDLEENELPLYRSLYFRGVVRKYNLAFAEKYCKYRNAKKYGGKDTMRLITAICGMALLMAAIIFPMQAINKASVHMKDWE